MCDFQSLSLKMQLCLSSSWWDTTLRLSSKEATLLEDESYVEENQGLPISQTCGEAILDFPAQPIL